MQSSTVRLHWFGVVKAGTKRQHQRATSNRWKAILYLSTTKTPTCRLTHMDPVTHNKNVVCFLCHVNQVLKGLVATTKNKSQTRTSTVHIDHQHYSTLHSHSAPHYIISYLSLVPRYLFSQHLLLFSYLIISLFLIPPSVLKLYLELNPHLAWLINKSKAFWDITSKLEVLWEVNRFFIKFTQTPTQRNIFILQAAIYILIQIVKLTNKMWRKIWINRFFYRLFFGVCSKWTMCWRSWPRELIIIIILAIVLSAVLHI